MEQATKGRVRTLKQAVARQITPGAQVLEIGCGTGELAAMLVSRGASVRGFDHSPAMLAIARQRIEAAGLSGQVTLHQMDIEGMDDLPASAFEAVVSTLVFSELNQNERRFALRHAFRVLKPGGRLVLADEVVPRRKGRRILHTLARAPLLAATYLVSRTATKPLADLTGEVKAAGFTVEKEVRSQGDAVAILTARRPADS